MNTFPDDGFRVFWGACALVIGTAFWIGANTKEKLFLVERMILLMGFPWIPYFLIHARGMSESPERLERQKVFGDNEFMLSG